jgi:competence protein ComEA
MKPSRITRLITLALLATGLLAPARAADTTSRQAKSTTTEATSSARTSANGKVDVNTADIASLEALPGVGPQTAKAIMAARPFSSVADLERVPGIGPAKMAELKGKVTASKPATSSTATAAKSKPAKPLAKVDVNTADRKTLEALPGVGPQTAQAIMVARPFSSVDDLERVSGIGPAKMAELRDRVTVSTARVAATRDRAASSATRARENASERPLSPTGRPSATTDRLINLNISSKAELESLPEIGPVKAQAIIEARPFSSVEDVTRVKGIKSATLEAIKDKVTVK